MFQLINSNLGLLNWGDIGLYLCNMIIRIIFERLDWPINLYDM